MAQRSGFFNSKLVDGAYDRPYDANDYSSQLGAIIGNGVGRSVNDDLKVTVAPDGQHLNVNIGRGWINGVWYHNTSTVSIDVPMASTAYPRIDTVVLRLAYVAHNGTEERRIRVAYVEGQPSSTGTPERPAPTRNENVWELVLADIYRPANSQTTVLTENITDQRGNGLYKLIKVEAEGEEEETYKKVQGDDLCGWMYAIVSGDDYFATLDNYWKEYMDVIDEEWEGMKDAFSSVTLFKKYEARVELESTITMMEIPIAQYSGPLDILEVFVNGIYLIEGTDYTVSGNVITFVLEKPAGNEIDFAVYKSIDSRGDVASLLDIVTNLQNKMSTIQDLTEYNYFPTGVNDNWKISEIVQNYMLGGDNGQQLRINVFGTKIVNADGDTPVVTKFHIATPYSGEGISTSNRYRWFDFGSNLTGNRRVILDFSNCDMLTIPIRTGSYNVLFNGSNITLIGGCFKVEQIATYSEIQAFASRTGDIKCYRSSFLFKAYTHTFVAENGLFEDCYAEVSVENGEACCFYPHSTGLVTLRGGEYRAYSPNTGNSAVVKQDLTGAGLIMYGVNCSTVAKDGYNQTHAVNAMAGTAIIRDTITTLTITGGTVSSTIAQNKPRR